MPELLVGIDVGATGIKAGLFDPQGRLVARASRRNAPRPQEGGHPDWLIWDGDEVWAQVCDALREVTAAAPSGASAARRCRHRVSAPTARRWMQKAGSSTRSSPGTARARCRSFGGRRSDRSVRGVPDHRLPQLSVQHDQPPALAARARARRPGPRAPLADDAGLHRPPALRRLLHRGDDRQHHDAARSGPARLVTAHAGDRRRAGIAVPAALRGRGEGGRGDARGGGGRRVCRPGCRWRRAATIARSGCSAPAWRSRPPSWISPAPGRC